MLSLALNKPDQANSMNWIYIVFAAGMSMKLSDERLNSYLYFQFWFSLKIPQ